MSFTDDLLVLQPLDMASSRMQTSEFGKSKGLWKTLSEGTWREAFDGLGISLLLTSNPSIQVVLTPSRHMIFFDHRHVLVRNRYGNYPLGIFVRYIIQFSLLHREDVTCIETWPCIVLQYTVFDQLKQRVLKSRTSEKTSKSSSPEALSASAAFILGAVSKCVATVLTYPAIRWMVNYSVLLLHTYLWFKLEEGKKNIFAV